MRILLTGAAGFIGYHSSLALLERGNEVVGVDNLNDYYDVRLKHARLARLQEQYGFSFHRLDLADRRGTADLFDAVRPDAVLHLAAQAGVRYSLEAPHAYVDSNLVASVNVLEGCRRTAPRHLVFASSSSVYGSRAVVPFSEHRPADHPVSLYAATKRSLELIAHTYSHLFDVPVTGLRFFTVYGPWGRPDMAYYRFTQAILEGRPIDVYNGGKMYRDFTFIDDVVEAIVRILDHPPRSNAAWTAETADPATSFAPFRLYNVGNNRPVELSRFIEILQDCLGVKAKQRPLPMQPGDVPITYADVDDLQRDFGYAPSTPLEEGIERFVSWYLDYSGSRRRDVA